MTLQRVIGVPLVTVLLSVGGAAVAQAQTTEPPQSAPLKPAPAPPAPQAGSKWWIVGGGGFSMARAGCAECSRAGVFTNSTGLFFDIGGRVSPRVDVGGEVMFVTARIGDIEDSENSEVIEKIDTEDPVRTTFILAIVQFRPWIDKGLYLRAGMGVGFAGNGLVSRMGPELQPPYSTNALGVTYGLGWIFKPERRWTVQAAFSHHVAAIGELATVSGVTIKNVVGNYWTSGVALVFR